MTDIERNRLDFLPGIAELLGYYVYALRDPRDKTVFYIGKGKGARAYQHARHSVGERGSLLDEKLTRIHDIPECGLEVIVEIARYQLADEREAYEVEAAVIDALVNCSGAELENRVSGHGHDERGWASLESLRRFAAKPVDIPVEHRPCLLIRPRRQYRYSMSEPEMWEITRKEWKVGKRDYKLIFCVHDAIIRGVWRVTGWDSNSDWSPRGRRGFLGVPAVDVWDRYIGGYVGQYLPTRGGQIPFTPLR